LPTFDRHTRSIERIGTVGARTASALCPFGEPASQIYVIAADFDSTGSISIAHALLVARCIVGIDNGRWPE
jgi:hypothetical protein